MGQVVDDAREEPGFRDPEEEAQRVEATRAPDEHHGPGHQRPADHDAADPAARPDTVQDEVARDLEQAVADEENARTEPIDVG
jgi:hypothetical protein